MELTHIDEKGAARMVDISSKQHTARTASAQAVVRMSEKAMELLLSGTAKKGDILPTARIAGIMAAKKTAHLIPLCHSIPLSSVEVKFERKDCEVRIISSVSCTYGTGAEMEALTCASVAALTIYDMLKAADKSIVISDIMLLSKTGGKSGDYNREP